MPPVVIQSRQMNGFTIDHFVDWHQLGFFESCQEAYRYLEDRWAKNGRCKEVNRSEFGLTVKSIDGGIFEIRFFNWKIQKVLSPYVAEDWNRPAESPWQLGLSEALNNGK